MKISSRLLIFLSVLSTIVVSAYLVIMLDWKSILLTLRGLNWGWFSLALLSYFMSLWLRSIRFRHLLYLSDVSTFLLLPITGLHNAFNYILPARSGELSYLFLANKKLKISISESATTLLASRFYDLAVVAVLLMMVIPFFIHELPNWVLQTAVLYCLAVLFAFGFTLYITRNPVRILEKKEESPSILLKIRLIFNKMLFGIRQIREKKSAWQVALNTVGIWLFLYANFYFITLALGHPVSYIKVILISLVMVPLSTLPVQGFANVGTHELGWVTVLMIFGYDYSNALSIAVGSHLLLVTVILFFGMASLIMINFPSLKKMPG